MEQPKLGKKIATLRKEKGLTQEELIEKCNVSIRTIQRIEAGEVTPRSFTVKAIFEALEYNFELEQEKFAELEKACTIKPNWFQEPKAWVMISSIAAISFILPLLGFVSVHFLKIDYYLLLIVSISIEAILVGNFFATQKKRNSYTENQEIIVRFNPAKILGFLLLNVVVLIFIVSFIMRGATHLSSTTSIPIYLVGFILIAFLLFPAYLALRFFYPYLNKFTGRHKNIGLKITEEGFLDNSMFRINRILTWEEIERIEVINSMYGYKWIVPILKNPEVFISEQTSRFGKLIVKSDNRQYGSPLRINTNTINVNPSQLYKILCLRLRKSKS